MRDARTRGEWDAKGVTATVTYAADGSILLDDPVALAVARAVGKHNCRVTFEAQADRVAHFKQRIADRGEPQGDCVIVLLNVDDLYGGALAEILVPGHGAAWQAMRDGGLVPFARGLARRDGIEDFVSVLDPEAAGKLRAMRDKVAVVVMDHGVVEIFEA